MKHITLTLALAFSVGSAAGVAAGFQYQNPVGASDYPDPSVIRVGSDYWATATSSEWAPHFPILHSRDLVNWEVKGYVFQEMPKWAKANFWAPEIAEDNGKYFIYYTAREIASNRLAVAVATANHPAGPWTDHGPMIAQEAGSIDGVPFTDAKGVRWLVWKEDGNSKKLPTPLAFAAEPRWHEARRREERDSAQRRAVGRGSGGRAVFRPSGRILLPVLRR